MKSLSCVRFLEIPWTAAFLGDPSREIEENNKMGMSGDLFKKMRDSKVIVHAKMGSVKDRHCMDLRKAEDMKKSWQEHPEELYKKMIFMTQISMMV